MRALLIANADDADAGCVGEELRARGFGFTECHRERPGEWPELGGHDLVLTLGSEWSVYWPEVAASVAAEADLVARAHAARVPVLGICFGHQVLCHALGGSVQRAVEPEIGWFDVDTVDPTAVAAGPWLQWHYDVACAPPGAVELARSPAGLQAWRCERTFATQFHPEATETIVARWSSAGADELVAAGVDRRRLLGETREVAAVSRLNAERLVDWFCEHVAG